MNKVLIITTNSGFVPQFEMNDIKILEGYGYQVHYASNFCKPVYQFDQKAIEERGIRIHHIDIEKSPLRVGDNIRAWRQLRKIIRSEQIDLIHCHNPVGGVLGRLAAGCGKKAPRVIYTAHGFHFYENAPLKNWLLYYPAERILAHRTDILITINREDYGHAGRFHLRKGGCVERIHGVGVDTERFRPMRTINLKKRKELGIPGDAFHIVSVAELNDNKNQQTIIRAMAELSQRNVYYSICGTGQNEEKLKKLAADHGVENRVKLLGYRTDVEEVLQTADCFVFPSIREGFGIAAVEALACGVPVIAGNNRGTREYMRDGINGILCPPLDRKAFARAIGTLYEDPEYRQRLAAACRESILPFSLTAVDRDMRRIYRNAAKTKTAGVRHP
ncbi:MAG: glycosyltransferase family 4 protein [Clostridium sp.]|nr:glycosyltransferase family 4 protein [Clostridium sp.]